jgi:uncharacterized protein
MCRARDPAARSQARCRDLVIDDPDHSEDEERSILLGLSYGLRLLVVGHVLRADVVRIRSERKATPREAATYRRNR